MSGEEIKKEIRLRSDKQNDCYLGAEIKVRLRQG